MCRVCCRNDLKNIMWCNIFWGNWLINCGVTARGYCNIVIEFIFQEVYILKRAPKFINSTFV